MIDRITIQIQDVDKDYIVERLKLKEDSTREEDEVPKYVGRIRKSEREEKGAGIKVFYYPCSSLLRLDGSLHKFAHGYNHTIFTQKDASQAIKELEKIIGIELDRFQITKIEFGINMIMPKEPMRYINSILRYGTHNFIPMPPLRSTVYGKLCKLYNYTIKLYDKGYDTWVSDRIKLPQNIFRYEIFMKKEFAMDRGFININAKGLTTRKYYINMKRLLREMYSEFVYLDSSLDYTGLKPKDVKEYMFITSDNFQLYLDYLKEHRDKKDRDNAMTARRRLLKKIKPALTSEIVEEFKDKLNEEIRKISGYKTHI